jgi:4-amino-4-deoxy-L-arabinose transferase-like glycosyltransferase
MQAGRSRWAAMASSPWAIAVAIAALLAAVVGVSLRRSFLGTGVETDFSAIFAQEALRFLRGEPFLLPYHPPVYAFTLAIARQLGAGSWLSTGLWISGISTLVALTASVAAWRRLLGNAAAWGAFIALACSIPFRVSASVASSDMFFMALVCVLLLLIVAALQSPRRTALWAACGAVAACVFLTRTNGVVAAAVLALPLLVPPAEAERKRNLAAATLAFLLPLAAWSLYALASDSPILPVNNYLSLAVAVYGDGVGKWGEQMIRLRETLHSMSDVILHDPPRFVTTIARNLVLLPFAAGRSLTWPPITLLAVPGLVLMLWKRRSPSVLACLAVLAGMSMISGTIGYISRYHLVLIPVIGALAGLAFSAALDRLPAHGAARLTVTGAAILIAGVVAAWTTTQVLPRVESGPEAEFAEAAPQLRTLTEPDATVFSRSSSLVLETGRRGQYLAEVADTAALFATFCEQADGPDATYLYVGSLERTYRSALVRALTAQPPPWLERVARGTQFDWTLYRFRPDQSSAASCSSSSAT